MAKNTIKDRVEMLEMFDEILGKLKWDIEFWEAEAKQYDGELKQMYEHRNMNRQKVYDAIEKLSEAF